MEIGSFHSDGNCYVGRLRTLTLDVLLRLVPTTGGGGTRAPDWRVHIEDDATGLEVGSGWSHPREGGGTFIAVQFDCPTFGRPFRANLLISRTDEDVHVLLWSRPARRREPG